MLTIKINDYEYQIPTSWSEITVKQYHELMLHGDDMNHVRLLSIFTGLTYDVLVNMPCDEFLVKAVPEMEFTSKEFNPFHLPRKKTITIGGKELRIILDPTKERFGQKLYMQQLVTNAIANKANHITIVPASLACYYAPYLREDNKWDEKHVAEVEAMVWNMSIAEAFPEADFFLRGYMRYAPKKPTH